MNGGQYAEMFEAMLGLREAVELGFKKARAERHAEFEAQDDRWNRRFNAFEARVENGFTAVHARLNRIDTRLDGIDGRLQLVERR